LHQKFLESNEHSSLFQRLCFLGLFVNFPESFDIGFFKYILNLMIDQIVEHILISQLFELSIDSLIVHGAQLTIANHLHSSSKLFLELPIHFELFSEI